MLVTKYLLSETVVAEEKYLITIFLCNSESVEKFFYAYVSAASLHPNRYDGITVFSWGSCEKGGRPTYLIPLKYCYIAELMTSGHWKVS